MFVCTGNTCRSAMAHHMLEKMIKEKDIIFRVDTELKQKMEVEAKNNGLSLSAWIRFMLLKELNK